jgi:hypothetical protein
MSGRLREVDAIMQELNSRLRHATSRTFAASQFVIGVAVWGPVAARYVMTTLASEADIVKAKIDMKILVTGSAGHLGEALMRSLEDTGHEATGLDIKSSPFTRCEGSIAERSFVKQCMQGVDVVLHTATLHKPHIASHTRQDFVDTNITGTLNLLEEAASAGVRSFVFTSTTSVFGHALTPPAGARPRGLRRRWYPSQRTSMALQSSPPRICASSSNRAVDCRASFSGRRAFSRRRTTTERHG